MRLVPENQSRAVAAASRWTTRTARSFTEKAAKCLETKGKKGQSTMSGAMEALYIYDEHK
jgi:hypothetical protein